MSDIVPVIEQAKKVYLNATADLSEVADMLRFQIENTTILTDANTFSQLKELHCYTVSSATQHQTVLSQLAQLHNKLDPLPHMLPAKKSVPYLVRVK
jgi:hypothetical protein